MTDETLRGDMVAHHEATEALMRAEVEKLRAKVAAAEKMAEALRMVAQHGRIDDSESRMNAVGAALAAWEAAQ